MPTIEDLKQRIDELEHQLQAAQRRADTLETEAFQARAEAEKATIRSHLEAAARQTALLEGYIPSEVNLELQTGRWKVTSKGEVYRHDADGLPEMTTDGRYVTPLAAMRQIERSKPHATCAAPAADTSASTGIPAGTGPNPWTAQHWNQSDQNKYEIQHGTAAATAMAAEAGVSVYASKPAG